MSDPAAWGEIVSGMRDSALFVWRGDSLEGKKSEHDMWHTKEKEDEVYKVG